MVGQVTFLNQVETGVEGLQRALELGDGQAEVRKDAICTIDTMCDALQLACDLISKEISASILEFNDVRNDDEEGILSFFRRTAMRFGDPSLRILLHDGKVCGKLHALGDGFKQPFSPYVKSGVRFTDALRTFFKRTNPMAQALEKLENGEIGYLRSLSNYMIDILSKAENANRIHGDVERLRQEGDELIDLMRAKRRTMQEQVRVIREKTDNCRRLLP